MTTTASPALDVEEVLSRLTLEEKASLLDGSDFWNTQPIERLGVPAVMVTDGPHGLRKQTAAADHVGLNDSVPATCFPPAAGLVSSWDPVLLRRVGVALGDECRAERGGGAARPRREHEARAAERPQLRVLLRGPAAGGRARRRPGPGHPVRGVGTSLKHYAANNQETDRMTVSAEVDERTLREIYLPAFSASCGRRSRGRSCAPTTG